MIKKKLNNKKSNTVERERKKKGRIIQMMRFETERSSEGREEMLRREGMENKTGRKRHDKKNN